MYSTLQSAARSLKKKMHRVSAQNEDSRFKQAAANFLLQRYRSARQSPVQNISAGNGPRWRFRARQTAATFSLFMHNMAALSFFQGGVLRIHTQLLFFAA
jgi:hypothetical protein